MARDFLRGPAIIQFNGATFYSQAAIAVEIVEDVFPIQVSNFGKVDERTDKVMHRIKFIPDGRWDALATLFPYATTLIGAGIFGDDNPLTIWTRDGKKRVYAAAAVTKMPSITLSSVKTLLGEVEFTCIHAEDSAWADAGSLFVDSAEAYPGDTGYDVKDIITQPYDLQWILGKTVTANTNDTLTASGARFHNGMRVRFTTTTTLPAGLALNTDYFVRDMNRTAGTFKVSATLGGSAVDITDTGTGTHTVTPKVWSSFRSKEGVVVDLNATFENEFNDHKGLIDMTYQGMEVSAKLIPEADGMIPSDLTSAVQHQGQGALRGASRSERGSDLIITGTGVYVLLSQASLIAPTEAYDSSSRRIGAAEWRSSRTITAGVADPLFYVGTSAPA